MCWALAEWIFCLFPRAVFEELCTSKTIVLIVPNSGCLILKKKEKPRRKLAYGPRGEDAKAQP